ncbi:protein SIEVE ELEMENT OCCLUSION C [Silene latifolia]|uniref:protein SIEVE ELEMENT OCCLUSION C n=1 Tax=Silene latifolia TaxID=37657 RepID=UPI003D776AB0
MAKNYASLPSELEIPINSILIDHDPEGRALDSEMLLRVIESIMHHTIESQDSQHSDSIETSGLELDDTICMTANEILGKCYRKESSHTITLDVLALLGRYRWDAKLLLALSAFATQYGQFWVVMQSKTRNSLAGSISLLKQFPCNLNKLDPVFKALIQLADTMIEVIKSVVRFEILPIDFVELQSDTVAATKKLIYMAAYWVVRSITQCILLLINLRAVGEDKDEQFRDRYAVSSIVWEIVSLKSKISSISTELRGRVDNCKRQTEKEIRKKLVNLFQETHLDNQEVLRILFALRDDLPMKQSNEQEKVGISSLKNKVVILLISNPELLPMEELFFLVQQTYDHPSHSDLDDSYAILWVPICGSDEWSNSEVTIFNILSNSLPWYSISQPWLLSSTTIKYAKEEWEFNDKPIMVILDSLGKITNVNAADMLWTWGAKAYPFSTSREKGLWEEEKWSLKLLLNNVDPLMTMWVEERILCIYGSRKLDWIRDFTAKIKDIQSLVPELEVVYVGKNGHSNLDSNIICVIEKEKLSKCLSLTKIHLFWHRLESMRRSKLRLGYPTDTDHILKEIEALLTINENTNNEGWMIIGKGSSTNTVRLHGNEWLKFITQSSWKNNLSKFGLVNAIRVSLDPPAAEPCSHPRIVRYKEGLMDETLICGNCKHLIKKSIIYDAE